MEIISAKCRNIIMEEDDELYRLMYEDDELYMGDSEKEGINCFGILLLAGVFIISSCLACLVYYQLTGQLN